MAISIPILEYHDLVAKKEEERSFHTPYVLDLQKFHDQMQWLHKNGFQTISIGDLFNGNIKGKSIILTFDDGHISNYEHALPLLRAFDFQATFFIVAEFVGRENYLTIKHIHEMQAAGMHFESHSLTHSYLLPLDRKAMAFEISQSKVVIEEILNRTVNHFCIPYGFYNKALLKCVKDAGYKSAVTERNGYYCTNRRLFKVLPRFTMKAQMTHRDFVHIVCQHRSKMIPRYLVESALDLLKKTLGFRCYMRLKSLIVQSSR